MASFVGMGRTSLSTTNAVLYTAPANGAVVLSICLSNVVTTAPRAVTISLGGVVLVPALVLKSNQSLYLDLHQFLPAGQTIGGFGSVLNSVECIISGMAF